MAHMDMLSDEQIDQVVAAFYARVREHRKLGPVFADHIHDWPAHEAKVAQFWRKTMGRVSRYDGRPVEAHREAGNVRPGMFESWLELFDAVLFEKLPEPYAREWSALAHKIGGPMRAAVSGVTRRGGVPDLRGPL